MARGSFGTGERFGPLPLPDELLVAASDEVPFDSPNRGARSIPMPSYVVCWRRPVTV